MGCGSSKSTNIIKSEQSTSVNEDDKNQKKAFESHKNVQPSQTQTYELNNTFENASKTGNRKTNSDGIKDTNKLVPYNEACKAFPRPAPPPVDAKVDLDEFFSSELKAIYPGFDAMTRLDDHVEKTPKSLKQNIQSLVEYLMEITSTEYDKARVIIRWVATNIAYDLNFLITGNHQGSSAAQDVLVEGSAVCEGFSNLVLEMCQLAGLTCEKINGIAKGSGYEIGDDLVNGKKSNKFRHAWNRIKISNTWFLCDATWASGYPKRVNGNYQHIFHWNEGYFLVPPETMRYSHKPYDSTFTMLEQSITDLNQWTNEARVFPSCCLYKMSSVTPPLTDGCIKTDSNRVELQFRSIFNMNLRYTLIDDATDENVENSVASFTNKKLTTLFVRLPRAGLYSVVLFGEPVHLSDCSKEMSQDMLLSFKVHTTCVNGSQKFPDFTHLLGSLPAFTDGGFRSSVNFPIIETEDGYARFTVNRPGGEPIRFKFRYANGTELDEYIFGDTYPEKVVFNIRCPKKGEYSLTLFARFNDDLVDNTKFKPGATYLILNKNERVTPILPYPSKVQWGPTDNLSNFNISLQPQKGAEITCNKEEATFELGLSSNEQINISYKFNTKEDKAITSRWVCAENNWREKDVILRFRFRAPVSGFYEFNIFAGKVGAKSNDCIGSWLINVVNPYEGDLFIGSTNVPWGPNVAKMKANDLQVLSPTSSTIYSSEEESTLIIASKIKRRTGIIFNLKNDSGNDMLAGLTCEKINGIAKGSGYEIGDDLVNGKKSNKFRHAWNRIKISNTWFLCDATWASGYPSM
ncbi:kyphoscoliosis peptidase-like [Anneissia japonica]|uniref:kyphoscoliosis peptidase-like n=1 Tax=Anneissia japonica TaxID=1529436 RepID=UPI001425689E|nr:kyphoscoliosis peptidase-like [Anneissia japonica]